VWVSLIFFACVLKYNGALKMKCTFIMHQLKWFFQTLTVYIACVAENQRI